MVRRIVWAALVATVAAEGSCNATNTTKPGFLSSIFGGLFKPAAKPMLHYFDIRGRAEAIRMALADNGVEWEDAAFSGEDWGKERTDGIKANWTTEGRIAFGQVPLLEIDGLKLVQSQAILRYLGRKLKWYTGSPATLAQIDIIAEGTEDVRKMLGAIRYSTNTSREKQTMVTQYFQEPEKGPRWIKFFENIIKASKTEFMAGTPRPTHADYLVLDLLDLHDAQNYNNAFDGLPDCAVSEGKIFTDILLAERKTLKKWREMMRHRPKLKAYLTGPDRRDKPCDGLGHPRLDMPIGQVY